MSPGAPRAAGGLIVLIRGYQRFLSPLLGRTCRYEPTCSEYACQCLERYGLIRGSWLAARRIGRCHPFGGQGFDPVPERYTGWGRSDPPR